MAPSSSLPALALILNALVWGVSWWPFRQLDERGWHPLWTTAAVYGLISVLLLAVRPRTLRDLARPSALWVLLVAAGTTNAAFNWAVSVGDVVRVVLLFYLMPLWAVLLARLLLQEAITGRALLRVALGMLGAYIVLSAEAPGAEAPGAGVVGQGLGGVGLADGLAVLGGFSFALNNIMVRREQARSEWARAAAMFLGGAVVAGGAAMLLTQAGRLPWPQTQAWGSVWPLAAGLAAAFLVANGCLQYGASRLPAQRTAVIMLTEVLFAAVSAVALGAGVMTPALALGGACILASAWLAAGD